MPSFYTYLARCSDGSLYAGYCKDPIEREAKHNEGVASRYTRSRRPVVFVYKKKFKSKEEAMSWEGKIKRMSKAEKEKLIK